MVLGSLFGWGGSTWDAVVGTGGLDYMNLLSLLFTIGTFVQERRHHEEALSKAEKQHNEQVATERICNLQSLETDLKSQIQALGTDLTLAGKEADRDMWEQRNTEFQTLMLAATVMFGGGLGVIVQGVLPHDQAVALPEAYVVVYSTSLALGFGMLFISIIASMVILKRMCQYMYCRARNHRLNFGYILQQATEMFRDLRKMQGRENLGFEVPWRAGRAEQVVHEYDRFMSTMVSQIEEAWIREHARDHNGVAPPRPHQYQYRSPVHPSSDPTHSHLPMQRPPLRRNLSTGSNASSADDNTMTETMSFPDFWENCCKNVASVATNNFYAGTLALLIAVATLTFSQLAYTYRSPICAILFAVICAGCALVALYYHVHQSNLKGMGRADLPRMLRNLSREGSFNWNNGNGHGMGIRRWGSWGEPDTRTAFRRAAAMRRSHSDRDLFRDAEGGRGEGMSKTADNKV